MIKKIILMSFLILITINIFCKTAIDFFNDGVKEYFNENYSNAIYNFKESIKINPNYIDPHFELAKIYYELENYEYSYIYIKKALEYSNNNINFLIFSANVELKLKMFDLAEKKYLSIIKNNPLNIQAQNGLANLYMQNYKYLMAKKTLDNVLKSDPNNFEAVYLTAKYYETINKNKADYYFQYNIQNNSLNPDSFYYYSIFNYNNNKIVEALDNIKTAIQIKNSIKYLKYYGKYLLYLNQSDKALEVFREIIKKTIDSNLEYYDLAYSYFLISDFENSINSLKKVLNLREDDELSSYLLNNILINNYNVENENRKKRSNYFYLRSLKAKSESNYDLYIYLLKESIRLDPKNVKARVELAEYFLMLNFPERYLRELEVASQYTNDKSIFDRLEVEKKRLSYKIGDSWNINQYQIKSDRLIIPLFINYNINNSHYNAEKTISEILKNMFSSNMKFEIIIIDNNNIDIPQKMNITKQYNSQYYLDLYSDENMQSITLKLDLVNSNNAEIIKQYISIKNGNDKIIYACQQILNKINQDMILKAHIIKISNDKAVINAGRNLGIKLKDQFIILKNKNYPIEFNRANIIWTSDDIKGKATAIKVDENITEIKIELNNYYNDIDVGDIIIYKK